MYGSIITLLVKGVIDVGGLDIVWERNVNSSRIEFFKSVHQFSFFKIYLLIRFPNCVFSIDTALSTRHSVPYLIFFQTIFFNILIILYLLHIISKIWSVLVGGFFYWTAWYGTDQSTVQRFLAMPSLRKARM